MGFEMEYRRATEAAAAAREAGAVVHAAMFDFAGELGHLVTPLRADGNPLGLRVRFVRNPPPALDAPAGVKVEDAKDRAPSFASVVLEAQDLWIEIRSDPGVAVGAATNIAAMEEYAAGICGIRTASDNRPRLLRRMEDGSVEVSHAGDAESLLAAFLLVVGDIHVERALYNPLPRQRPADDLAAEIVAPPPDLR